MRQLLTLVAALLLLPAAALADDLSATLAGSNGQGLASLVTGDGEVAYTLLTNGIGTPTRAIITQGSSPNAFLELGATFVHGVAAGTAGASAASLQAIESNPGAFQVRVEGPGGVLTGALAKAAEAPTGGGGDTSPCQAGPTTLCLSNDRFELTAQWATSQGTSGAGQAVELTDDTGYFWFFDASNVEAVVKVLNSCSFADRFWVFAGGLTNVEVSLRVRDTKSGEVKTYTNPQATPFQPIQDTNAFATCP